MRDYITCLQPLAIKMYSGYTNLKKITDSVSGNNIVLFQYIMNFHRADITIWPPGAVFGRSFFVPPENGDGDPAGTCGQAWDERREQHVAPLGVSKAGAGAAAESAWAALENLSASMGEGRVLHL